MEGPIKERLTGALILVAALVIIVPEILSGPSHKPARTAQPEPADGGAPLRTYSMELNAPAESGATGQATLAPQPAAAEPSIAVPEPVETPAATGVPAEPATAAAAPEPPAPTPPPARAWWSQLGSFSSRDNAERLARTLRAAGYSIDVSRTGAAGKELYRVRAGPEQSRADAEALQARLASSGHKSSVVAP